MTNEQKEELIKQAKEILKTPYSLKNNVPYSAAVLTSKGNIYSAVSYFSDTFTLTLHGEQAALSHAADHGENEIEAMAVASTEDKKPGEFTNPCHLCKQLMYESQRRSGVPMTIILTNNHGETKEVLLNDMISFPWPA